MLINFPINILILTKKNYDSEDLNKEGRNFFDPSQLKIFGKKEQKSNSTEGNTEREVQKLL